MIDLLDLSIRDIGRALRQGDIAATGLLEAHLDRIARLNPHLRAFVALTQDKARVAAARADLELARGIDRGPLHGIPFAVKDSIDLAGTPVRHGARMREARVAATDAAAVTRLLAAGAVPLGMVAAYDLCLVGPSEDGAYPPARNPWDPSRITGGSSSGSAAAVAAGLVPIALGSDSGGSIRAPAAYCGAVGLKPRHGRVPTEGTLALAPSLDCIGPIARTVEDVWIAFQALVGAEAPAPLAAGAEGLRVGYARDWFAEDPETDPATIVLMDAAASELTLAGLALDLVTLPDDALFSAAGAIVLHAESFDLHAGALAQDGARMGRMAFRTLAAGAIVSEAMRTDARRAARTLTRAVDTVLDTHDALLVPTVLTPAPTLAEMAGRTRAWTPMRTLPFNLTGHPALSVPMGLAGGLPLGLQIVGRDEATICRIGHAYEMRTAPLPRAG